MTNIVRYVAPYTENVNGRERPEHHFWLNLTDYDDQLEVANWITYNFVAETYQYWPETVSTGPATSAIRFHVILQEDRDAALFKLRW